MARWWMGAALVTLGLAGRATAQPMVPPPGGPGPMPMVPTMTGGPSGPASHAPFPGDPVPLGGPEFCPPGGPQGPDSPFSLPNDGSPNAFGGEEPPGCHGPVCYFNVGWMALTRDRLGNGPIAYLDPGVNIPGVPSNVDTGNGVSPTAPVIVDFHDIHMNPNNGVRATLGYREGDHAIELSGFYLFQTDSSVTAAVPGRLDALFAAFPSPLGFQGNNFLWLQADLVRVTVETTLANAELNYRCCWYRGLEWLVGGRFVDLDERFSVLTNDDGLTVQPVNPTQIANYSVRSHSRIVGLQLGVQYECPLVDWAGVGFSARGCWGPNFLEVIQTLERGDGFVGPGARRSNTVFSHLYEVAVWGTIRLNDQIRVRGGYQTLWLVGVPEAHEQTNFDPGNPGVVRSNTGSIFWHGPMVELQLCF